MSSPYQNAIKQLEQVGKILKLEREIVEKLDISEDKIFVRNKKASEFLKEDLNVEKLSELFPQKTIFDNEKR